MELRIKTTGEVLTESAFREKYRDRLIPPALTPEWLNDFGVDVVFEGPQATPTTVYQFSFRNGVEKVGNKWYTKYSIGPVFHDIAGGKTAAQQEADYKATKDAERAVAIRQERDAKLAKTDWTQLTDAPVNSAAWATYRQSLRDVTAQTGFPWNVEWPSQPE